MKRRWWMALSCVGLTALLACKPSPPAPPAATRKPTVVARQPQPAPVEKQEPNEVKPPVVEPATAKPAESPATPAGDAPKKEVDTASAMVEVKPTEPAPAAEQPTGQTKRMVLYTPSGPVIVEFVLRIDGRGAVEMNDAFMDTLLKAADTNMDGKVEWSEAITNQRTGIPQFIGQAGNAQEFYDRDRDGEVDRSELWNLLGHGEAGLAFRLEHYDGPGGATTAADVARLIDTDADGSLTVEEMDAAPAQLRLADVDDDERLSPADLGAPAAGMQMPTMDTGYSGNITTAATILDNETDWGVVQFELDQRYLMHGQFRDEAYALFPDMSAKLDADANGLLSNAEAEILNFITPQIRLEVDFGGESGTPKLKLADMRSELSTAEQRVDDAAARLDWPSLTLSFTVSDTNSQGDPAEQAKAQFAQVDQDKNNYLEESEIPDGEKARFKAADANGDGKVYLEEMTAALKAERSPLLNRVRAVVTPGEHSLLAALDADRDGSLSLREINEAAKRLRECDRNQDGRVTLEEVPTRISVQFERGGGGMDRRAPVTYSANYASPIVANAPNWFRRMDHNADGDISPREFLGSAETFQRLDQDADGLLSLTEATSEEKAESKPDAASPE